MEPEQATMNVSLETPPEIVGTQQPVTPAETPPPALCPAPVTLVVQSNEERAEAAIRAAQRILDVLEAAGGSGGLGDEE